MSSSARRLPSSVTFEEFGGEDLNEDEKVATNTLPSAQLHSMETTRIKLTGKLFECDPSQDDLRPTGKVNGERVLYECWAYKRSRWLGQWRLRWMVLTPSKLLSYPTERGYGLGEQPTEVHAVPSFRSASPIQLLDLLEGEAPAAPLTCLVPAAASRLPDDQLVASTAAGLSAVSVRLVGSGRQLLLSLVCTNEDERPKERRSAAVEFATVNAFCAIRTGFQQYLLPGTMHAFEARGLVALRDRFAVEDEIGRGAFGVVYRGRCLQSGRAVAIKKVSLLPPRGWRGAGANPVREMLLEEVSILRSVRSPHVVSLLNYVEDGCGHGCLVMELLPGGNLYTQVLERYSRQRTGVDGYSERELRDIMRMALNGLAAVHDHRVVHRDLKPENVLLLDRRGGLLDLCIADFGVARRLGPTGHTIGRAGSHGYMAPEVLSDRPYGLAADVWSMGVILYTLLCGRMPFFEDDSELEEAMVREGSWSFGDSNWDEVSYEAKDMVRRLLTLDPFKRPTVQEALDLPWLRFDVADEAETDDVRQSGSFNARSDPYKASSFRSRVVGRSPVVSIGSLARNPSLPGSMSLLHLSDLEQRKRGRGETSPNKARLPPQSAPLSPGFEEVALVASIMKRSASFAPKEALDPPRASTPMASPQPTPPPPMRKAAPPPAAPVEQTPSTPTVEQTPSTADAMRDAKWNGDDGEPVAPAAAALSVKHLLSGTDVDGRRVRIFTAERTADRAITAGVSSFCYSGEMADAIDEQADAKMRLFAGIPGKVRHGQGEAVYDSGNRYTGQWKADKRDGAGRFEYACGDVYEGEWREGRYEGKGHYLSPRGGGDEYDGEWQADKPHGYGRYRDGQTGEVYEGEWYHGMRDGKGRVTDANGKVVEGTFEAGERVSCALTNAAFRTGIDESGKRIRMFTATLTCERVTKANLKRCVYEGQTAPADHDAPAATVSAFTRLHLPGRQRHGYGRIQYECGNVFEGQWCNDVREGDGTYWYACGDVYNGQWKAGKYEGGGKYTGSDIGGGGGDTYDGQWRADQPHGQGRYTYRLSGHVYEGQWSNGQYHGEGTYYDADGAIQVQGRWKEGLLVPLWQREVEDCPTDSMGPPTQPPDEASQREEDALAAVIKTGEAMEAPHAGEETMGDAATSTKKKKKKTKKNKGAAASIEDAAPP